MWRRTSIREQRAEVSGQRLASKGGAQQQGRATSHAREQGVAASDSSQVFRRGGRGTWGTDHRVN